MLLELLSKFSWIISEKIIQNLDHCPVELPHLSHIISSHSSPFFSFNINILTL